MQRRLEEATSRLSASESEMTAQLVKKEAKLTKQQQASEKAASKAASLLDQKEEELQQLQAVIADIRETMKKNKVAEDEAEEGESTSFFTHNKNLFKISHSYNLLSSHVTT
jgi:chromosome segregation ATPase